MEMVRLPIQTASISDENNFLMVFGIGRRISDVATESSQLLVYGLSTKNDENRILYIKNGKSWQVQTGRISSSGQQDKEESSFNLQPDGLEIGRFRTVDGEIGGLRNILARQDAATGLGQ